MEPSRAANGIELLSGGDRMWKKGETEGIRAVPTWAIYAEAMNKFSKSGSTFMEHVHLLTEADSDLGPSIFSIHR